MRQIRKRIIVGACTQIPASYAYSYFNHCCPPLSKLPEWSWWLIVTWIWLTVIYCALGCFNFNRLISCPTEY